SGATRMSPSAPTPQIVSAAAKCSPGKRKGGAFAEPSPPGSGGVVGRLDTARALIVQPPRRRAPEPWRYRPPRPPDGPTWSDVRACRELAVSPRTWSLLPWIPSSRGPLRNPQMRVVLSPQSPMYGGGAGVRCDVNHTGWRHGSRSGGASRGRSHRVVAFSERIGFRAERSPNPSSPWERPPPAPLSLTRQNGCAGRQTRGGLVRRATPERGRVSASPRGPPPPVFHDRRVLGSPSGNCWRKPRPYHHAGTPPCR